MSNSTFNVTEPDSSDSITLVVGTDGTVTPDKETVQSYLSGRSTVDINLMRMKKVEAGKVNVTLDTLTYINSDDVEDFEEMDEIARNLLNFRMDHDYTPLTSPSHEKPRDPIEDELAHTLGLLEEGTLAPTPVPTPQQEPLTKITKIVKGKKQTIFVNSAQKAKMISSGMLKEKPAEVLFKKPKVVKVKVEEKKVEEELEDMEDEEEEEDDDDDSDFELEEEEVEVKTRRRTRSGSDRRKKEVKPKSPKKLEEVVKKEIEQVPVQEVKPPDKKIIPKKEKKIAKPLPPDDFALFSTPDIIRRVGKEVASPEKAVSPPKPAKIQPDVRSKSSNELKAKRLSTEKERRLSLDSKKVQTGQVLVQDFNDALNNSDSSIHDDQLQPLPSAEDIRAIIQNENTKSFTANLVIPDIPDPTMNLDEAGGLDLDQSILDNINTDMIPEDILMQVAQSLVDNTDLQNAIDKSIVDGNLVLDPTIQHISESALIQQQPLTNNEPLHTHHQQQQAVAVSSTTVEEKDSPTKAGTQIVRPDGRVVVIPPIERPATRSRNKKKEISPIRQIKPVHKPLDDQHVSGNELDTSGEEADEEDEDESEDDPNKLWCICNQPHNNRFMICCDTCEEWYHGKCVNVTKAMGQMMEQEGKEWICVYCKDSTLQRPKAAARRIRKASRTSTDSGGGGGGGVKRPASTAPSSSSSTASLLDEKRSVGPGCVVCGKPSRNSSIYCSDTCILKHAQGVEKVVVFDRKSGKLLSGNNAPSAANLDKWLAQNPTFEVVRSTSKPSPAPSKPATMTQSKLRIIKNTGSEGVSLAVHKKGVNIGVLQHAPKDNIQTSPHILNSKQTPKKIVNITGLKIISKQSAFNNQAKIKVVPASPITPRPVLTSTPAKPPKMIQTKIFTTMPSPKDKQQPQPQKTPKSRQAEVCVQPKQENLRETVRKTFFDQLSNRLKKVEDLVLTEEELKGISNEIESQLYKCFGDTGQKYKNKYRSLIFNIKDPKNQTLWRRICEKSVNPYQLVRLSPDDLASQELALWREREAKHQLDMIKKSELELLNCTRQFVFKTHKGEQVFEDDRPKDQVTEVISGLGADSTTEKDEEKEKEKRGSSRHKRDKSKDRARDRSRSSKDRRGEKTGRPARTEKKRSRSKDRGSSRHSDRKRSHSRDRHKRSSHRSSRHKKSDEKTIEKLDKKSKEILEQLVDKHIVLPLEDRLWKDVPQEDVAPTANVESDSDHEPSSTVTIPTPPRNPEPDEGSLVKAKDLEKEETSMEADTGNKTPEVKPPLEPIWKGIINMVDVAQISITAHEVSGDCNKLGDELPASLDIVGRISPDTVWDYIGKMKNSSGKTISLIRLTATNMEERMPYLALYSYLSSRNRLGVVKSVTKAVKDFYILPLAGNTPIPDPLLPLTGPGFEDSRPALLLGILVRDKRKRGIDSLSSHHHTKRVRVEMVIPGTPPSSSRSYTPPPSRDPRNKISSVPLPVVQALPEEPPEEDMDEPYSPEDSDPDVLPEPSNSRLNASDISSLLTGSVKTSSFLEGGLNTQSFEPFTNKFDTIPGLDAPPADTFDLQRKMAELDQRIAAQKAEIDKVSQDLVSSATDIGSTTLANIALPSNLQQILESIKTIGSKTDSVDSQGENSNSSLPPTTDLTIPLLLPKLSSRSLTGVASSLKPETTIPLNLPKSKPKSSEAEKPSSSVLSSLSEEDLIKKAAEMLGEEEGFVGVPPEPPIIGSLKKARINLIQPPIPGLESD